MKLVCATINDKNDWETHMILYNWGYENYCVVRPDNVFKIPVISGESDYITAGCEAAVFLTEKDEIVEIEYQIPKFIYAPAYLGQTVGSVRCTIESEVTELDVKLTESLELDESVLLNFWEQLKWSWYYYNEHSGNVTFVPMY